MSQTSRLHRYTYADYVALELDSPGKHEFFDGEIYAMAGGTEAHSALCVAVTGALLIAARGGPCRVHSSDLRIYVEAVGLATFPDGSIVCGALEQHGASPRATALNPRALIEITSDSSEEYDTGLKREAYETIPSLRDILIVSHRERRITVYHRDRTDGDWIMRVAVTGGRVAVDTVATELVVDEIYAVTTIGAIASS